MSYWERIRNNPLKTLEWTPNQAQARFFYDDFHYHKVLAGGYGSGKTYAGIWEVIKRSINEPNHLHAFIEQDLRKIRLMIIPAITALLNKSGIKYDLNKTDNIIRPEWSVAEGGIIFLSGQNPSAIVGWSFASCHIDEPALMDEEVFKNAMARTRGSDDIQKQMSYSLTWDGVPNNWTFKKFWENPIDDIGVYLAPTYLNIEHVGKKYIEELQNNYSADLVKLYLDGYPVAVGGGFVYMNFKPEKHVIENREFDPKLPLGFCFDFNYDPMTCTVVQYEKPNQESNVSYAIDEIILAQSDISEMASEVKKWIKKNCMKSGWNREIHIFGDATGDRHSSMNSKQTHYDILENELRQISNFVSNEVPNSNPGVSARFALLNRHFLGLSSLKIKICERCKNLIRDYSLVKYKQVKSAMAGNTPVFTNQKDDSDKSLGHSSDNHDYYIYERYNLQSGGYRI